MISVSGIGEKYALSILLTIGMVICLEIEDLDIFATRAILRAPDNPNPCVRLSLSPIDIGFIIIDDNRPHKNARLVIWSTCQFSRLGLRGGTC